VFLAAGMGGLVANDFCKTLKDQNEGFDLRRKRSSIWIEHKRGMTLSRAR
jgi:hypothetical protein